MRPTAEPARAGASCAGSFFYLWIPAPLRRPAEHRRYAPGNLIGALRGHAIGICPCTHARISTDSPRCPKAWRPSLTPLRPLSRRFLSAALQIRDRDRCRFRVVLNRERAVCPVSSVGVKVNESRAISIFSKLRLHTRIGRMNGDEPCRSAGRIFRDAPRT